MAHNEVMIKKMRSWYNKAEFEKNDAGCPSVPTNTDNGIKV